MRNLYPVDSVIHRNECKDDVLFTYTTNFLVIIGIVRILIGPVLLFLVWFELQKICVGVVRIKNIATGRYLAMDKNGVVRGRVSILPILPLFISLF